MGQGALVGCSAMVFVSLKDTDAEPAPVDTVPLNEPFIGPRSTPAFVLMKCEHQRALKMGIAGIEGEQCFGVVAWQCVIPGEIHVFDRSCG